jgi:hypothetical protein
MSLPLHTYHNNSNLGSLAGNVRSFRLKRGYMATHRPRKFFSVKVSD